MLISVCIPSYNRANCLGPLLDSILAQNADFEVVIAEDASPERDAIRAVAERYQALNPGKIRYFENDENLGYDGNLRRLVELAQGDYIMFAGNDDLLAPGALANVSRAVTTYPNVGVVLRSYASFEKDPSTPVQVYRYFDGERLFKAGAETISVFFRRSVFITGMVVRREPALQVATDRFDGTLLYQQHLVGQILARENGVYLPDIISYWRLGGIPDFGNSKSEQGRFVPREVPPHSSVAFVKGMLEIAADLERTLGLPVYGPILHDIGNYAYPILSIQAKRDKITFFRYVCDIAKLGLWRVPLFYVYATGLLVLGQTVCDGAISFLKARLGRAPMLGRVKAGQP